MTVEERDHARGGVATPAWLVPSICVGLVALVVGTFLPWLHSGRVTRNSYVADGVLRRVLRVPDGVGALLAIWPYLSLVCAAAAALALVGLRRSGAAIAAACALASGALAYAMLSAPVSGTVRPAGLGPGVTLAGAALVIVTVVLASLRSLLSARPHSHPISTISQTSSTGRS